MSNRKTRERQLAKLAARRAAERRKKRQQRIIAGAIGGLVAVAAIVFLFMAFVGGGKAKPSASSSPKASHTSATAVACGGTVPPANSVKKPSYPKAPKFTIDRKKTYIATMKTSCGTIRIELTPKTAPDTVNSLVYLANHHFFDGTIFHRTVKGFVIQGGDPYTAGGQDPSTFGTGGPGYKTADPPPKGSTYPQGTVAMAKGGSEPAGTSGSQFFVVTGKDADAALAPKGQGPLYAIVGKVIKGLDVALKIEHLPRAGGADDAAPAQTVYIVSLTIKEKS